MLNTIREIQLFSALPYAEVLRQYDDSQLVIKKFTKGMVLSNQKDICDTLDVLLSGVFVAYSLAENGSIMQVFEFSKKQALGANLLFGDNHTYPFTIYCETDGEVLRVTRKAVSAFLHYHDFALAFIIMLSQNSQRINQKIRMGLHNTLRENLLEYLDMQTRLQESNTIKLPISKKQLADYLGVQRPSLFRELKKLKDEGIITSKGRYITLHSI